MSAYANLYSYTNDLGTIDNVDTWIQGGTHLDIIHATRYSQLYNIELYFNTLNNIFNNLRSLKCSSINVTSVKGISFKVSNLTFINVDFTNIKYDYFKGLIKLQKLGITGNNISYIQNETFGDLNSLLTLYLMAIILNNIPSGAFDEIVRYSIIHKLSGMYEIKSIIYILQYSS